MKGYTLIELLVSMVIIAIIALVGAIVFNSFRTQHLWSAAERVGSDLRYARNLALATGRWHGVEFFPHPANSYYVYETDGATDTTLKDPTDSSRNHYVVLNSVYQNIIISGANIQSGSKVEFSPLGQPFDDKNGSPLAGEGTVSLSDGGATVTVRIVPEVGRVYLQ